MWGKESSFSCAGRWLFRRVGLLWQQCWQNCFKSKSKVVYCWISNLFWLLVISRKKFWLLNLYWKMQIGWLVFGDFYFLFLKKYNLNISTMLRSCKVVSNDNLVTGNNIAVTNLLLVSLVCTFFFFTLLATLKSIVIMKYSDQYQYLGNCPPTPPLTQQQSIDNKLGLMLG